MAAAVYPYGTDARRTWLPVRAQPCRITIRNTVGTKEDIYYEMYEESEDMVREMLYTKI